MLNDTPIHPLDEDDSLTMFKVKYAGGVYFLEKYIRHLILDYLSNVKLAKKSMEMLILALNTAFLSY